MADEKAVVLNSRDAFESKHMPFSSKTWWKLYTSILVMIIAGSHLVGFNLGEGTFVIAILLAIVFGVIIFISRIKNRGNVEKAVNEICSMKFKLGDSVTVDDVYSKTQSDSVQVYCIGATFEREGDKITATYDEVSYEIILNGDGTFSIIGKSSSKLDKAFYNKIREGTPIIAFGLQQAFGVK